MTDFRVARGAGDVEPEGLCDLALDCSFCALDVER